MTISEIAKMAGVSPAAVSRYLNNGYISDDKREIIKKVIDETGYQPSLQAQMLRTKKTKLIQVLVCMNEPLRVGNILTGISSFLNQKGYDILYCNTLGNTSLLEKFSVNAKSRGADGIILVADDLDNEVMQTIASVGLPVMLTGCRLEGTNCVYHDYFNAAKDMTTYTLGRHNCKLAYIGTTPKNENAGTKLFEGYKQTLSSFHIPLDIQLVSICDSSIEAGIVATETLMKRCPRIDAILCATENLAIGARKYLNENPANHDILITGFGHSDLSDLLNPPLITMIMNDTELGTLAATEIIHLQNSDCKDLIDLPIAMTFIHQ